MNHVPESLAAYSLSLPGRDELRKREEGYSTRASDISPQVLLSAPPESARLKTYCHGEVSYDKTIAVVFQVVVNSEPMIGEEECAPGAFTYDLTTTESYAAGEDEHQDTVIPGIQTFNQHLANFAGMSAERRLAWDPYQFVYETAKRAISEFALKLGQNPGEIAKVFDVWLFAHLDEVPFLQYLAPLEPLDSLSRSAHRYKE
jgi:hypothetical protein